MDTVKVNKSIEMPLVELERVQLAGDYVNGYTVAQLSRIYQITEKEVCSVLISEGLVLPTHYETT